MLLAQEFVTLGNALCRVPYLSFLVVVEDLEIIKKIKKSEEALGVGQLEKLIWITC